MPKVTHTPVRDIIEGGPLDRGLSIHMTLDCGKGRQNPTISFSYYTLGRVLLIIRKLALAAIDERRRHNLEQRGQPISTHRMTIDDFQIAWVDLPTASSMIRFESLDHLTFDLDLDYDTLTELRDQIDKHLATREMPVEDRKPRPH